MVTTMGMIYMAFGTLLFGFWIYGIISFYYDMKRQVIPYLHARRERVQRERAEQDEAINKLSHLYDSADDE
jgi:hypothetical protein